MKKYSVFGGAVLALTGVTLLLMTGWFAFGSVHPSGTWRVEVERTERPEYSASAEEGGTDSLLEGEVVDLNRAGQADLERLPGIGAVRAQAILEYREKYGAFKTVDELTRVEGIGPAVLERLRPCVTVGELSREQN